MYKWCNLCKYQYQYLSLKYQYLKMVLKYSSSTSTTTLVVLWLFSCDTLGTFFIEHTYGGCVL